MVHIFVVEEPIFNSKISVFVGTGDRKEISNTYSAHFNLKTRSNVIDLIEDKTCEGLYHMLEDNEGTNYLSIILIDYKTPTISDTVIHECIHIVTKIFDYICMNHNNETDEAYAYLHGFYVSRILSKLKTLKEDKKNGNVRKTGPKQVPKRNDNNKS